MTAQKIDYSNKTLFKMSWPIFVELMLQLLVGNMDQIQLSHFNDTAVAAVGNANQIITLVILVFNVITLASMILITQYSGAKDMHSVNLIYTLSVAVNAVASVALAVLLIAFRVQIFDFMQVPESVKAEAQAYLLITALSLPLQALMLTFSAFLRAGARMKTIMYITGLVNVCNIIGNAVLINGFGPFPRMGAAGAALSSSIFRVLGFALMAWAFFRNTPQAKLSPALLNPFPKHLFKRLLSIGLPSAGENFSYSLSQMSCLVFVNMMGTYVVTTRAYANIFATCIYMLIAAVSQAGQIIIGYLIGARDLDGADRCCRKVIKLFCPINVGVAVLMAAVATPLFSLLTNDPAIIALGQQIMLIEVALEVGRSVNIVMVRNLQAVGDVAFPTVVGILSQWILGVGLGWLLGVHLGMGLVGLWLGFTADENVRGAVFIIRWKSGKWKKIKTI